MLEYLYTEHNLDVLKIVKTSEKSEIPFKALQINLTTLKEKDLELFRRTTDRLNVWIDRAAWISALNEVQQDIVEGLATPSSKILYTVKRDFPVSFFNHTEYDFDYLPYENIWKFVQIKAKVYRTRERGKQEVLREYKCRKCKVSIMVQADRITKFHFNDPKKCTTAGCKGTIYNAEDKDDDNVNMKYFIDYQEIRVQPFDLPEELVVELDGELVETCFIGDQVTICGTYEYRSTKDDAESITLVMRAASVYVHENHQKMCDPQGMSFLVENEWQMDLDKHNGNELLLRDEMVSSVAPELDGLAAVKLGLLLVLCSGGSSNPASVPSQGKHSSTIREIAHWLAIGDPGVGKSQLLKAAANISTNAVRTVGYSATTAGLTATCYKEDGHNQIEAGILVKANNGICCIDELNLLSKEHRGAIHEVMESQKITMNKCGVMTELNAKCSIIAGMNQRNSNLPIEAKNISIEGSLLSRFDFIFELEDIIEPVHDAEIADLILFDIRLNISSAWNLERLQMHVAVAKELKVEISDAAVEVLKRYYLKCKHNAEIDKSRTTMRLYNSLERLTMCHAKLLMRKKADMIDAVVIVQLMESSWSFGYIMKPINVMKSKTPLGPTNEYMIELLQKLGVEYLLDEYMSQLNISKNKNSQDTQDSKSVKIEGIDEVFENEYSRSYSPDCSLNQSKTEPESSEDLIDTTTMHNESCIVLTQSMPAAQSALINEEEEESFSHGNLSFRKPSLTSTQLQGQNPGQLKRTSNEIIKNNQEKKRKEESSQLVGSDPLFSNLNSLAAMLASGTRIEKVTKALSPPSSSLTTATLKSNSASTIAPTTSKIQVKSFDKLRKFQYEESTQPSSSTSTQSKNNLSNSQVTIVNLPNSQHELSQEDRRALEELDFWDDDE